jgi:hypothetical protein
LIEHGRAGTPLTKNGFEVSQSLPGEMAYALCEHGATVDGDLTGIVVEPARPGADRLNVGCVLGVSARGKARRGKWHCSLHFDVTYGGRYRCSPSISTRSAEKRQQDAKRNNGRQPIPVDRPRF